MVRGKAALIHLVSQDKPCTGQYSAGHEGERSCQGCTPSAAS